MAIDFETVLAVFAVLGYFVTFAKYAIDRKKDSENRARESQKLQDKIEELSKRVDSHNRYAEMFREYGEDIAFIRGKLE